MMTRTYEEWLALARAKVRLEPGETDRVYERIAAEAVAAEQRGETASIWHAASVALGTTATCPCVPCNKARFAAKLKPRQDQPGKEARQ